MRGGGIRPNTRYYRCTGKAHGVACSQRGAHAEILENAVCDCLATLRLPVHWQAKVLMKLKSESKDKGYIARQKHLLEGELRRARSLFVAGEMPRAEYRQHQTRITRSLDKLPAPKTLELSGAARIFGSLGLAWQQATPLDRKRMAVALLTRVWVKTGM